MKRTIRVMMIAAGVAVGASSLAQQGQNPAPAAAAQSAQAAPAAVTRPANPPTADDLLKEMLKPTTRQAAPSLDASGLPAVDESTRQTVAPRAQPLSVMREGSYVFNRVGRLSRTNDGQPEFIFDSDGQAMQDPPLLVHPNLKLWMMESAAKSNPGLERRFRVTGMVTEYGNRNYILIEKMVVVPELAEKPAGRR